jgi:type I restriction enzyme S subunit
MELLGNIVKFKKGKKPLDLSSENSKEKTLPYIDIKAFEKQEYRQFTSGKKCVVCEDQDIVIVWDGARSGLSGKAIKGALGSTLAKVEFSTEVERDYIFYFLQSQYTYLNQNTKGTGIPHIDPEILNNLELVIPSKEEQQRIIKKLNALMERINANQARLDKIPQILRRFRQSVLQAGVSGKLTLDWRQVHTITKGYPTQNKTEKFSDWKQFVFPKLWNWDYTENIGDHILGKMLDSSKNQGELTLYLRNKSVRWFNFDLDSLTKIKATVEDKNKFDLRDGDIFICEGGEPGRAAVWNRGRNNLIFQKAIHRIRLNKLVNPYWYIFNLKLDSDNGNLEKLFTGTGIKHLTLKSLSKYPIPIPPIEEQQEIIKCINELFNVADRIEARYQKVKQKLEKLPQSILAKAFRGELLTAEELEGIEKETSTIVNGLPEIKKAISKAVKILPAETIVKTYNLKPTTVHAGIIAKIIDAHTETPLHANKLEHIKAEKISHLIEYHLGIDLGRTPKKLAAGPADFPHLKKVEHHANLSNWFTISKIKDQSAYSYKKSSQFKKILTTIDATLKDDLKEIEKLIKLFLPMDKEQAEVIATVYAAWNNFLIDGKKPTDEQIVKEARENWTKEKLNIERPKFFKALEWLRKKKIEPKGLGKKVV